MSNLKFRRIGGIYSPDKIVKEGKIVGYADLAGVGRIRIYQYKGEEFKIQTRKGNHSLVF